MLKMRLNFTKYMWSLADLEITEFWFPLLINADLDRKKCDFAVISYL